jgi:S1-C subfamily serine protease
MLRALLVVALMMLGLAPVASATPQADPNVRIILRNVGLCSGFAVDTALGEMIVSAGHCAADAGTNAVVAVDTKGNEYPLTLAYYDGVHDVSAWTTKGKLSTAKLPLACKVPVTVGEHVADTGYPDGVRATLHGKVVKLTSAIDGWPAVYLLELPEAPGASGSAVTNAKGEVIGILVGGNPLGMSIAVPISILCSPEIA